MLPVGQRETRFTSLRQHARVRAPAPAAWVGSSAGSDPVRTTDAVATPHLFCHSAPHSA